MKIVKLCAIACVITGLWVVGCSQRTTETPQIQPPTKAPEQSKPSSAAPSAKPTVAATPVAATQTAEPNDDLKEIRTPDVIFWETAVEVVDKMIEMAKITKDDLVYDLGCGDGAIVVEVARKVGCKCVGYDIDPQRVREARANVAKYNLGNLVRIEQKDIFTLDLSPASVITLYLLPSLNVRLIPQLEKLKPGSRIVSHDFDMEGVTPDQVVSVESAQDVHGKQHTVYLWTTPLKKEAPKQK
jgi:SAM-dependent methyltransferase